MGLIEDLVERVKTLEHQCDELRASSGWPNVKGARTHLALPAEGHLQCYGERRPSVASFAKRTLALRGDELDAWAARGRFVSRSHKNRAALGAAKRQANRDAARVRGGCDLPSGLYILGCRYTERAAS